MISGSDKPVKSTMHKEQCILCLRACLLTSLFPLLCSGLGEQDVLVSWLAVGDARCFSLDRSAAATMLCNLSVFVSG